MCGELDWGGRIYVFLKQTRDLRSGECRVVSVFVVSERMLDCCWLLVGGEAMLDSFGVYNLVVIY